MMINRKNYEAFFLDYHDGNLDEGAVRDLMSFLSTNPDLKEEFDDFKNISLAVEQEIKFSGKEKIKRATISAFNYKTWLVAFSENDLNISERIEVEDFLKQNPVYKAELSTLNRAKLLPDTNIRFKNKSSLKKGSVVIPMWLRTAAAAIVVIGILAYWFTGNETVKQVAVVKLPKTDQQEIKATDLQIKINSISKENKSSRKPLAIKPIKQKPANVVTPTLSNRENDLEKTSPLPVQQNDVVLNNETNDDLNIVIHSTGKNTGNEVESANRPFTALDDKDLAELGLITTDSSASNGFIQTAVNGAGNLLGVDMKYYTENNLVASTQKKTFTLGKIKISRTVMR